MRILLATNHLGLGGSESYLLTVAEQLDRLAHEPVIYAPELGNGVAAAERRGIRVAASLEEIAEPVDAAIAQDAGVSYEIAERLPRLPQVFVAHSESHNLQAPPQLPGTVSLAVALNDRVADRLRSYAAAPEVVRLRQPVDTERFLPGGTLPERPTRALLLSNNPNRERVAMLRRAFDAAGIALELLGGDDGQTEDPLARLHSVDFVVGYGRSVLEAMACGRAAYVYDWHGGDGWVTAESYPEIEGDGFAGRAGRAVVTPERLEEDLARYDPAMGPVNRELAVTHHRANAHAQELVGLLAERAAPPEASADAMREMARLVRLEWRARDDVYALQREVSHLRELLRLNQEATDEVMEELRESERERHLMLTSTSWRLTRPLRRLTERLGRRQASASSAGSASRSRSR